MGGYSASVDRLDTPCSADTGDRFQLRHEMRHKSGGPPVTRPTAPAMTRPVKHSSARGTGNLSDESSVSRDEVHPEERCERCGGPNIVWHAPSPLWNAVMREADGTDAYGIVCPLCFVAMAEWLRVVEKGVWHLAPEPMPDLPQTNADGRVWDPAQCLWVAESQ